MMRMIATCALIAMGCDAGGGDGHPTIDSPLTGSGGFTSNDTITCTTHTESVTVVSSGTKTEYVTKFAIANSVHMGDDFAVERCGYSVTINGSMSAGCPTGYTCTSSGAPYPAASDTCNWVRGSGDFSPDGLIISCGSKNTSYDGTGAVVNSTEYSYAKIVLHH
jgi:hypothetical protein